MATKPTAAEEGTRAPNETAADTALNQETEYKFLDARTAVFDTWTKPTALAGMPDTESEIGAWERNERRLRGGEDALDELTPFDWEGGVTGERRYLQRRAQATFINFAERMAQTIVGHLFRDAPTPGRRFFAGGLGKVRDRGEERTGDADRAELLWYNVDGTGNDGSQWNSWWAGVARRAMATGHRWIFVDNSPVAAYNRTDEAKGRRPFLAEFSPTQVPFHWLEQGHLAMAIVRIPDGTLTLKNGTLQVPTEAGYLLLVRKGVTTLGPAFEAGGWWIFTHKRRWTGRTGNWQSTDGEIPLFPLFYERDTGTKSRPAMSRPATTELGQLAISYMNLSSAADFDAWDAAGSVQLVVNATPFQFNSMIDKMADGSRWAPLPPDPTNQHEPKVHDGSNGAVAAEVFEKRLDRKMVEAESLALSEATSTPDSSGESKRVGFSHNVGPRLALFASELEQAMNTALHYIERRWGIRKPTAVVQWPREFDNRPILEDIAAVFDLQERSGLKSATLGSELMTQAVKDQGLVLDTDTLRTITAEYIIAAFEQQGAERQDRAAQAGTNDAGTELVDDPNQVTAAEDAV